MKLQQTDLENIQKAIDVEIKNQYIDLRGKKSSFSEYIAALARNYYLLPPKDKRWGNIAALFGAYTHMNIVDRMKAIKSLQAMLLEPATAKLLSTAKTASDSDEDLKDSETKTKAIHYNPPEKTDVKYVKGVGPVLAKKLYSLQVFTVSDLLSYYPRDHIDFKTQIKVADLEVGQDATIFGVIKRVNSYNSKSNPKLSITTVHVYDGSGIATASWFLSRSNKYVMDKYKDQYPIGAQVLLSGRVKQDKYTGKKCFDKPTLQILYEKEEEIDSLHTGRIVPIYKLTEGLSVKILRRAINNAIENYLPLIRESLPPDLLNKFDLLDKQRAVKLIHFPEKLEDIQEARKRLIFEEFFIHQLHLAMIRAEIKSNKKTVSLCSKPAGLVEEFLTTLPFKLTDAQQNVYGEILSDLESDQPMHRLLQGDVGSGKTVVACMTLLTAIENGYQAAIMAPTEVLAEQHYRHFVEWLTPLGIKTGLFLGKHGVKQRRELNQSLENGQIKLAVGTHALIQENINFNNLGLVVIDEQHRFGVMQRTKLKGKGSNPELLTMSATPIPRTLALTMHGDLDVSIIDQMPPGRKPVRTMLLSPGDRIKAYRLIEEEIKKSRQVYIVFPLIEESEKLAAKAATAEAEKLKKTVFKNYRIGLVHGKLPGNIKEEVMDDFRKGKYDILVATTVIEVGVDVPNATVMMIENADRFGLAQLHQLRGRVGRSEFQSYCILVSSATSEETRNRLAIMEKTNNGFTIADFDLQLRGPGEFTGTKQSGVPDFILANITEHAELLEMAREAAFDFVNKQPLENSKKILSNLTINTTETFELLGSG